MPTLKDQFYEIANCHNRVTLPAGCFREILKLKPLAELSPKELKAQHEKLISILDGIENAAFNANQKVIELKDYIYETKSPDTNFTIKKEST